MNDLELDLDHLTQLRQECIDNLYLCAKNVTKYLKNNKEDEVNKLKKCLQEYIISEAEQNRDTEALNNLTDAIDSSNIYEAELIFTQLRGNISVNVDSDPRMCRFKDIIQRNVKAESGNLNESDVTITQVDDRYVKDPITKKPIQDPVKNTICGHIYEREAIKHYQNIKCNRRARCPVVGCGNQEPLQIENLISDIEYRQRIARHNSMSESDTETSQEY
ncbi:unnamed protein product [Euphydryas editha]|uniref:E3 SUMO-protein ligase NSE2 n=1 Tax=Euphydryas editha TaxID=104508 RepID=A0AAU9VBY2_EUPED|nr:unnamed protein product [Euphydryas editha]